MSSASSFLTANTANMPAFLFSLLKGQCHEMYFFFKERSYKSKQFVKILPGTLFRGLVPAFRKPPATLKVVPKAACDS
jgi:hypothetical protein